MQWHGAARTWNSGRDGIHSAVVWVDGVVWGRCRGSVVGSVRVRRAGKGGAPCMRLYEETTIRYASQMVAVYDVV